MKILFVTHASFEQPGSIEAWAKRHNHNTSEVRPYLGEFLPVIDDFDMMVLMGGPQSPIEIEKFPYLIDEIELVKQALKQKKRILGVCLGAQLITEALGANTERSPNKEIGMYPVELLADAASDPVFGMFPASFDVMHWHSDMPGLADGVVLLAKSEGCTRQIFRYGDRVYGFQCHFELTKELVEAMIKHCNDDLIAGKYVMSPEQLMALDYRAINAQMDKLLDYLSSVN
ncbi:MAG TPA: GMP synthase [Gammaproteobacteria bacterium]|jgi:GMP synthase (glutamine-hydrolysing)|nr:GMP synthase [Gammaproteobacteria bacterium]